MADTIKYSSTSDKVSPLHPGQLGFSYKSKTLFIGPSIGDATKVIPLVSLDNNVSSSSSISINPEAIIIQTVAGDLVDKVPSSRAIAEQLSTKASLVGGNNFSGSNLVPDVDIRQVPYTLGRLIVNVNSIKAYIDHTLRNTTRFANYVFSEPSLEWIIDHDNNTTHCNLSIYNSLGQEIKAPIRIVSTSKIIIYLSFAETGWVDVVFGL